MRTAATPALAAALPPCGGAERPAAAPPAPACPGGERSARRCPLSARRGPRFRRAALGQGGAGGAAGECGFAVPPPACEVVFCLCVCLCVRVSVSASAVSCLWLLRPRYCGSFRARFAPALGSERGSWRALGRGQRPPLAEAPQTASTARAGSRGPCGERAAGGGPGSERVPRAGPGWAATSRCRGDHRGPGGGRAVRRGRLRARARGSPAEMSAWREAAPVCARRSLLCRAAL